LSNVEEDVCPCNTRDCSGVFIPEGDCVEGVSCRGKAVPRGDRWRSACTESAPTCVAELLPIGAESSGDMRM